MHSLSRLIPRYIIAVVAIINDIFHYNFLIYYCGTEKTTDSCMFLSSDRLIELTTTDDWFVNYFFSK